ncbi:hypothetical protein [Cellulomonas alba]|uniref:DUF4190 domain-containing protein n=1 Tax=Cellulomonas alba TaxID=3053467 RepID=A0ABT7SB92_9CELL|nr:hypothetical protein [Cellulomonas alba]MDM7853396.1 hypothetical protein [Cellulomonas alba]
MNPALTALVAVLALALSSAGGSFVVTAVLRAASRSTDAGHEHAEAAAAADPSEVAGTRSESDGPEGARARAALRGGMWIGLLERIAVTGCVLIGAPSGVAVVVAVKGLGRYPELRENPGVSERFVIGSLASLLWAAFVGWVAISVLGS